YSSRNQAGERGDKITLSRQADLVNTKIIKPQLPHRHYHVARPPVTSKTWPVVKLQAGDAMKAAILAISSGVQNRPIGMRLFLSAIYSSVIPSSRSVTAIDGAMQFTVIS
mgnify:CR=1